MEEETPDKGSKSVGKEEVGEGEWASLNTLSFRKTKIWQDYSISLKLKRGEEIVVVEKIWMEGHLVRVDKESWT